MAQEKENKEIKSKENKENKEAEKENGEVENIEEKEMEKSAIEDVKSEKGMKIIGAEVTQEMQKAYIDYAMSVIVSRALPSVEDGLKPVQRRILFTMQKMGLQSGKLTRKSARIVGDVMGHYHPHGDTAIYDALVRMAQPFSLRYPLVHGQGNFGSQDGDPPAAMRYTEARLDGISSELLQDLDKKTVNMLPNFDNTAEEPETLPGKLPCLLINGATGIAVGMATNIPPHNLTEVCDAIIAYISKPGITIEQLARIIKGPDFPTGGYVNSEGILDVYKTGKGRIILRGKTIIEQKKNKQLVVITEIPYMLNKATFVSDIANLVQQKKLPDVSDIRDESARGKVRIVIELRRNTNPKFTINRLYRYTRLQSRFDANIIALVKGKPQILNLKKIIENYVLYRKEIVVKRSKFELRKAQDRLEIVLGLLKALKNIDIVISLIKKSKQATEALESLQKKFSFTKRQAQAILETRLQQLTSLEQNKLKREKTELEDRIKEFEKILGSEKEILAVIKKEVSEIKRKYGDNRRTYILQRISEISEKDLVQKKDVVITITDKGYAKRFALKTYKEQKRGGRGVIGSDLATGDFVKQLMTCSTHDYLLFFTSKGKVYWLKAYQLPEIERYSKGKALINLLSLKDESVQSVIAVKKFENYLIFVTKKGIVKKIPLSLLNKPRLTGIRAINLPVDGSDNLIDVKPIIEKQEVVLVTKKGQAIRFNSGEVRAMGRASYGVHGIRLEKGDEVVSLEVLPFEKQKNTILTITEKGYGKRSLVEDYRLTGRAGKGVINLKVTERTGGVVTTVFVNGEDSIIVTTAKSMVIRTTVKDIRVMGRITQGVRIVKLRADDKVTDLVKVPEAETEAETEAED